MIRLQATIATFFLCAGLLTAQEHVVPEANGPKSPSYEISSVRPNKSDSQVEEDETPDGFRAKAITLQQLVTIAYAGTPFSLYDSQIEGGPTWFRSKKFDVDAKVDGSDIPALKKADDRRDFVTSIQEAAQGTPSTRMRMLQALLVDRFKLQTHYVTKELLVYDLVVAKGGSKVKVTAETDPTKRDFGVGDGSLQGKNVPLSLFPTLLTFAKELGRPVIDKTDLKGSYDFELKWTSGGHEGELPVDAPPGLFIALQEQIGLRLEPAKGLVRVLVIDHAEMPAQN